MARAPARSRTLNPGGVTGAHLHLAPRARVPRPCTELTPSPDTVTASISAAVQQGQPVTERSERCVVQLVTLIANCEKLTYDLADCGDALHAGMVGAQVSVIRGLAATMDVVAASLNSRPLREDLHGVRQDQDRQTHKNQQMPLLRQE